MRYAALRDQLMDAMPTLFATDDDVLEHLFIVIGNGFEWQGGELIERQPQTAAEILKEERERYQRELAEARQTGGLAAFWTRQLAQLERPPSARRATELDRRRQTVRKAVAAHDRNCVWFLGPEGQLGRWLYPLCQYTPLLHVPVDVQPDWLAAAEDAYQMTRVSRRARHAPQNRARNLEYLRQARRRLQERQRALAAQPQHVFAGFTFQLRHGSGPWRWQWSVAGYANTDAGYGSPAAALASAMSWAEFQARTHYWRPL
jgi:hypothetical protein